MRRHTFSSRPATLASSLLSAVLVSSLALAAPGASYSGSAASFGASHEGRRESFERVSRDGAVGWEINFDVPRGRGGATPVVKLAYSSRGAVRGGIAAGWSLPVSRIAVDTSQGRAQALSYAVDGARLVRVQDSSVATSVEAFRAEGDAQFARYEHLADGTEQGRWVVRYLDGSVAYYGTTAASRDVRSADSTVGDRTWGGQGRWFLDASVDAAGNRVTYVYLKTLGYPKSAPVLGVVDLALAAIEYGANDNVAGSAPHARVDFRWDSPQYCPGSRVPIGAQLTYRNGIRTLEGAQKLLSIDASVRTAPGSAWVKRRELTLSWDANAESCTQLHAPLRVLTAAQLRVTSPDGVVSTLPAQTFEYGPLTLDFAGVAPVDATALPRLAGMNPFNENKPGGWPALRSLPLDLDGDGQREALTSCEGLPRMPWTAEPVGPNQSPELSAREGCSPTAQVTHRSIPRGQYDCQGGGTTFFGYRFFDATGDGLPDLVAAMNYQKGDYIAEDDALLTQRYPQAYPACTSMPAPPCAWGSARGACWLNQYTQHIAKPDGTSNNVLMSFFTTAAGGGGGTGGGGGSGVQCPADSCTQYSGCTGTEGECCNPSYCAQDGHGPQSDPPSVVEGNHFAGPSPSPVETTATVQPGSERCAFVPDMHCGHYVWWVYPNKGALTGGSWFEAQPRVVFSPIPLESDNMTTGSRPDSLANASMYRAVGDLDGDGLPDAIYQVPEDVLSTLQLPEYDFHVWWGQPSGGFAQPNGGLGVKWPAAPVLNRRPVLDSSASTLNPVSTRTRKLSMLSDLNGDGLIDLVNGTNVFFNTGTGFEANATPLAVATAFDALSATEHRAVVRPSTPTLDQGFNVATTRLIDLDLDGLEDLVVMSPPNNFNPFIVPSGFTLRAFMNVGDGFSEVSAADAARLLSWRQSLQAISVEYQQNWDQRSDVLDVNADGLPDLFTHVGYELCPTGPVPAGQYASVQSCGLAAEVQLAPANPLRVLRAVNLGTGARVEFTYASTNDAEVVSRSPGSRLTTPLWVVKRMTLTSGTVGEAAQVTDYRYADPVSNRDVFGRFGFRGFARTTVTGPTPATGRRLRTISDWRFDLDPRGLLSRTLEGEVWSLADGHEDLVRMTEHQYQRLPLFYPQFSIGTPVPALENWAVSEVKRTTCRQPLRGLLASVDACAAGAFFSRELTTRTALYGPLVGRSYSPLMAYFVSGTRRTASAAATAQAEDRLVAFTATLRATATELRLLGTSQQTTDGTGTVLAREESSFETTPRAALTEARRFIDASTIARTRFEYDARGNVARTLRPNQVAALLAGQAAAYTSFTYDAFGVGLASETNELGHVTRQVVDLATGAVVSKEGVAQGAVVPRERTTIDGFGRPREVRRTVVSGAVVAEVLVGRTTWFDAPPRRVVEESLKSGTSWFTTTSFLDGLGRTTRVERPAGAVTQVSRQQFDGAGNPAAVFTSSPRGTGESLTYTQFDAFGRTTQQKADDSAPLVNIYTGNYTTVHQWPADGGPLQYRLEDADPFGRVKSVAEGLQSLSRTSYVYDALDRVKQVTDADGVVSNITYDWAGRRRVVERAGNRVEARFDLNGNRTTALFPTQSRVADPVRYAAYWTYDALDRVKTITPMPRDLSATLRAQLGATSSFVLTWDTGVNGVGRLGSVQAPWGTTSWGYTLEGWVATEGRAVSVRPDGVTTFTHSATQSTSYDLLGNVIARTYPDGFGTAATFSSDERGRPLAATLSAFTPLEVARFDRNAAGLVNRRTTPTAGSSQTWLYDSVGRVLSTSVQGQWCDPSCTAGTIAGEQFTWFESGHPRTMSDVAKGRTFDLLYDDHLELRDARTRSGDYLGTFTFSPTGKVLTANVASTIPGADVVNRVVTSSYAPWSTSDFADPGAVRALRRADGSNLATMTWDVAGNLTQKVDALATLDFATDGLDMVREVKDQAGRRELYWYDHRGERVLVYRSAPASGGGAEVVHRFGSTEVTVKANASRSATVDVQLGAQAVARVTAGDVGAPELLFHGALSSLLAVQNVSGTVTARYGYGPWGETLYAEGNGTQRYDRRYEAKARDAFSRLSYFGFRYYDALSMSWTQGDPLYRRFPDAAGTDPRRMSPYVYVLNDPLTLVDPDGLDGDSLGVVFRNVIASGAVHESNGVTILKGEVAVGTNGVSARVIGAELDAHGGPVVASAAVGKVQGEVGPHGVKVEALAFEAGVGAKVGVGDDEVTGKALVGVGVEAKIGRDGVKLKLIAGVGGEVNWSRAIYDFSEVFDSVAYPAPPLQPTDDWRPETSSSARFEGSREAPAPTAKPKPKRKPQPQPRYEPPPEDQCRTQGHVPR